MVHATFEVWIETIYEIANFKGVLRNKKILKFTGTLFFMLEVLKILYTFINRIHTVASLVSDSNWGNVVI